MKLFCLINNVHICSVSQKGSDGYISLVDSDGVALYIVGADVVYLVTYLHVHISLALLEDVGEVLRALIGQMYSLYFIGDIYVVNGIEL